MAAMRAARSLGNFPYHLNERMPFDLLDKESLIESNLKLQTDASNKSEIKVHDVRLSKMNVMQKDSLKKEIKIQERPDIFRSELPKPCPPPKQQIPSKLRRLLNLIRFLILTLLSLTLFTLIGGLMIILVIIPRFLCSILIWSIPDTHILTLVDSFRAAGSEFYTVIYVVQGRCRMDRIRKRFKKAVNATVRDGTDLKYPNLKKRIVKQFGFYCFEDYTKKFDILNHVNYFEDMVAKIVDPRGVSQSKLFSLLQDDFEYGSFKDTEELEKNDAAPPPQWEVLVVPKFYYDVPDDEYLNDDNQKQYALIFRANTAILDKATALKIFQEEIIENATNTQHVTSKSFSKSDGLLICIYAVLLWPYVAFTSIFKVNRTLRDIKSNNQAVLKTDLLLSRYFLTSSCNVNFPIIKSVRNLAHTTMTSLLTFNTVSAARNIVLGNNWTYPKEFYITVRSYLCGESESICTYEVNSNYFGFPLERLHDAHFATNGTKTLRLTSEAKQICNLTLFWIAGAFPAGIVRTIYKWIHTTNAVLEIWPVGTEPYKVFGGHTVTDIFGWSSISGTCADFGVTVTSYGDRMRANIIGDHKGLGYTIREDFLCREFVEEYLNIAEICDFHLDVCNQQSIVSQNLLSSYLCAKKTDTANVASTYQIDI